jgi:hypothetical protein
MQHTQYFDARAAVIDGIDGNVLSRRNHEFARAMYTAKAAEPSDAHASTHFRMDAGPAD